MSVRRFTGPGLLDVVYPGSLLDLHLRKDHWHHGGVLRGMGLEVVRTSSYVFQPCLNAWRGVWGLGATQFHSSIHTLSTRGPQRDYYKQASPLCRHRAKSNILEGRDAGGSTDNEALFGVRQPHTPPSHTTRRSASTHRTSSFIPPQRLRALFRVVHARCNHAEQLAEHVKSRESCYEESALHSREVGSNGQPDRGVHQLTV